MKSPGFAASAVAVMMGMVSCTSTGPQAQSKAAPPSRECWWKGDGVSGQPKLHISLSEQCVRYYKGGQLVGVSPISSGREGYSTRRGTFSITEKDLHHRSTLYGAFVDAQGNIVQEDVDIRKDRPLPGTRFVGAEMPGFMRVTGAIGLHAGYLPGYPASHGCIRLPAHMAEIFYHATPTGTTVVIDGDASEAPVHPPVAVAATAPAPAPAKKRQNVVAEQTRPAPRMDEPSLFGRKKAKTPPVPRGQTLYLEE